MTAQERYHGVSPDGCMMFHVCVTCGTWERAILLGQHGHLPYLDLNVQIAELLFNPPSFSGPHAGPTYGMAVILFGMAGQGSILRLQSPRPVQWRHSKRTSRSRWDGRGAVLRVQVPSSPIPLAPAIKPAN